MYVRTYVCMYVCIYVCVCIMYVCMYECTYVCMHVCIYVCMCVCVCEGVGVVVDGWIDGSINGWVGGWLCVRTDAACKSRTDTCVYTRTKNILSRTRKNFRIASLVKNETKVLRDDITSKLSFRVKSS
jgi:hypothetical protein